MVESEVSSSISGSVDLLAVGSLQSWRVWRRRENKFCTWRSSLNIKVRRNSEDCETDLVSI